MHYNDNCGICRLYTPPPRHVAVRDGLLACTGGDRQSWAMSSLSQSSDGTHNDQHGSSIRQVRTFDRHFDELMEFKQKFGHCDVSRGASSWSLAIWCTAVRTSYWYIHIQIGEKPQYQLSAENIQRLEHKVSNGAWKEASLTNVAINWWNSKQPLVTAMYPLLFMVYARLLECGAAQWGHPSNGFERGSDPWQDYPQRIFSGSKISLFESDKVYKIKVLIMYTIGRL